MLRAAADGVRVTVSYLAKGSVQEPEHFDHLAVLVLPVGGREHAGQHVDGARRLLSMVGAHALPALVHEVQLHRGRGARRRNTSDRVHPELRDLRSCRSYGALPGVVGQRLQQVGRSVSVAPIVEGRDVVLSRGPVQCHLFHPVSVLLA